MSISSINYSSSVLGSQIRNINTQLTDLLTPLSHASATTNGTTTQARFKTVLAERQAADLGAGTGRLVQTQPTPSSVQVVEDSATSPFGLKINAVSSTLTGATVTGPSGSPVS